MAWPCTWAIMAEMFKRVRPFLERNIEKAKERVVAQVRDEVQDTAKRGR